MVVIIDDEAFNREFAGTVLRAAGWRVATAAGGEAAVPLLVQSPSLILVDLHMAGMSGPDTVATIRQRKDAVADAAILAYTTTPHRLSGTLHGRGFDGFIPKPCTASELLRAAARWVPRDAAPVLTRLEKGLGPEQIRALTTRFRSLLSGSLGELEGADAARVAHRIAGIAGTLGFESVGRAWLALSLGDESALGDARREARRAIMAIDQHLQTEVYHT